MTVTRAGGEQQTRQAAALRAALQAGEPSARLRAALSAGSWPHPAYPVVLVARCAVEPDFHVRDMLTWALTRHDAPSTVDLLLVELTSATPQARSQALHTLSKIGDRRAWPAVTTDLLQDADDEVARAAWRAAVVLVPDGGETALAATLATQLGRGGREVQLSLSRALVELGAAAEPAVERATTHRDPDVRAHAHATAWLALHPEEGFDAAVHEARRVVALLGAPTAEE